MMKKHFSYLVLSGVLLTGAAHADEPVCLATLSNPTLDFGRFGKFGSGISRSNGPQSVGKQLAALQISCTRPARFAVRVHGRRAPGEQAFAFGNRGDTTLSVQSAQLDGRAAQVGLSEASGVAPARWATQLDWMPGKYLTARDGPDLTRPHTQLSVQLAVEPRLNPNQSDPDSTEPLNSNLIFEVVIIQ